MAIERDRVASYDNEAVILEYDYDTVAQNVTAIYYKNALGIPCSFVLRRASDGVELFRHVLPANTPTMLTRTLSVAQRPSLVGLSISLDCGFSQASVARK